MSEPLTQSLPPAMQAYLTQLHQVIVPYLLAEGVKPNAINAREALANLTHTFVTAAPEMGKIIDTVLLTPANFRGYNVPLRLFVPTRLAMPSEDAPIAVPVMVYFHGGGGMAGSVTVYDKIYKKLADASGCLVVAPEYRLAPENRYPAAIDDAHSILKYLTPTLQQIGYQCDGKLIIAGDSGGGAITATLVQDWLANRVVTDLTITHQLLIYASLDYTMSQPSIKENGTGYLLEATKIRWYFDNYFSGYDDRELSSPFWTDMATLLHHSPHPAPTTLNFSAGYCPLRDEDIGYHQQLQKAGAQSELVHFADMPHAFLNMENLCSTQCQMLYQKVSEFCQD